MNGRTNGRTNERTNGLTYGRTEGRTDEQIIVCTIIDLFLEVILVATPLVQISTIYFAKANENILVRVDC